MSSENDHRSFFGYGLIIVPTVVGIYVLASLLMLVLPCDIVVSLTVGMSFTSGVVIMMI